MLKRITSMLLLLAILTACGGAPMQTAVPPPSVTQSSHEAVPVPASVPAPASTQTPVPTPTPTPTPAPSGQPVETPVVESEAKEPEARKIYSLHTWNPANYTYHSTIGKMRDEAWGLLETLNPIAGAEKEENPVDLLGFLATFSSKTDEGYYIPNESFYLTETQIYSNERGVLDATDEQCKLLYDFAKVNNAQKNGPLGTAVPQWLRYMNAYSITEVALTGLAFAPPSDAAASTLNPAPPDPTSAVSAPAPVAPPEATDISFTTKDPLQILRLARTLNAFPVQADSVVKTSERLDPVISDALITVKLSFSSGVVYDIYITDGRLDVMSSDMDYTLSYRPDDENTVKTFRLHAEGIYYQLHPEMETPKYLLTNPDASGQNINK